MLTRIKWRPLVAALIVMASASGVWAQGKGIGLGIVVGDPTGLSAKLWLSDSSAIDAAAAWSFKDPPAFHVHGDYLFHGSVPAELSSGVLMFHFGAGARVKLEKETRVGVRAPLGLDYWFENHPIDVFLEIAAVLDLVPATELDLNGGLGMRYFFAKE